MTRLQYQLLLHLIILIWGFTGILGKVIEVSSLATVWYRMLIAFVGVLIYLYYAKIDFRVNLKHMLQFLGVGVIVALHWVLFFESLKVSTVSVTLTTLAASALFASIQAPILFRQKIIWYELLLGLLVIVGLLLIFQFETQYSWGIVLGLGSAFCGALFTTLNGKLIANGHKPRVISMYEMLGGFLIISVYSLLFQPDIWAVLPSTSDWIYLLILGLVCTAFAFVVSVEVMRELSSYTVIISTNLEPIYSIILALIFFGDKEKMSGGFYIGALIILSTIFLNAWLKNRTKKHA